MHFTVIAKLLIDASWHGWVGCVNVLPMHKGTIEWVEQGGRTQVTAKLAASGLSAVRPCNRTTHEKKVPQVSHAVARLTWM
jgi:hypothetical protein